MSPQSALAQLRHLYAHMVNGTLGKPEEAAKGLLGPAIESLEQALSSRIVTPTFDRTVDCSEKPALLDACEAIVRDECQVPPGHGLPSPGRAHVIAREALEMAAAIRAPAVEKDRDG